MSWSDPNDGSEPNLDAIAEIVGGVRNKLLAEMLPAVSLAVGANETDVLGANYNMNSADFDSGWPTERGRTKNWRHCDIREVAYPYVQKVFDTICNLGGMKQ